MHCDFSSVIAAATLTAVGTTPHMPPMELSSKWRVYIGSASSRVLTVLLSQQTCISSPTACLAATNMHFKPYWQSTYQWDAAALSLATIDTHCRRTASNHLMHVTHNHSRTTSRPTAASTVSSHKCCSYPNSFLACLAQTNCSTGANPAATQPQQLGLYPYWADPLQLAFTTKELCGYVCDLSSGSSSLRLIVHEHHVGLIPVVHPSGL